MIQDSLIQDLMQGNWDIDCWEYGWNWVVWILLFSPQCTCKQASG